MPLNPDNKASLLTYPTMVETPFIIVTIGDYTFGVANKQKMSYGNYKAQLKLGKTYEQLKAEYESRCNLD